MTTAEKFKEFLKPELPMEEHACATGDCGHTHQSQCDDEMSAYYANYMRLAPITDAVAEVLDAVERVTTDESLLKLGGDAMNLAVNLILNKALAKLQAAMGDE